MGEKKKDIAKDLTRGRSIKKTFSSTEEEAKKVVKKVTSDEKEKEPVVRTTMDLPKSIHTAIKIKSAQEGISLKDYIVQLVKADLDLEE